jgi:hypothetical protein
MATQRATAKAIGVDHSTINKDLKPVTDVTNEAPDSHEAPDSPRTVTNVTPPPVLTQSGAEVVEKAERNANTHVGNTPVKRCYNVTM